MSNNWETGSTFSKKMLGRSNSIMTRNSGGSHSRRNSVSQGSLGGPHNMPSDHILSWRNNILLDNNSLKNGSSKTSRSDDRSVSPGKFNRNSYQSFSTTNSQNNLASAARQQPYMGTPLHTTSSVSTISPPPSIHRTTTNNTVSQPPTPSFSFQSAIDENPLRIDSSGKSYQFWNPSSWRNDAKTPVQGSHDPTKLDVDGAGSRGEGRQGSVVSKLSSDGTSGLDESDGEALSCKKCHR